MQSSLENFKPILKEGKLEFRADQLLYEIKDPVRQISLPIPMADVLTLCNGNNTVREIIEKIYKKQKSVRFRETCELILNLNNRGFFTNSDELRVDNVGLVTSSTLERLLLVLDKVSSIVMLERFSLRLNLSHLFPLVALVVMGVGLYFGLNSIVDFHLESTFRVNGSYFQGLAFFFLTFSFMVTFKTLVKTGLLLMATSKVFELKLRFTPLFFGLTVSNESANTIKRASFRTLYFLAVISSHFWSMAILSAFFQDPNAKINFTLAALLLWGYEMNPLGWGELKDWVGSLQISDRKNPWYLLQYQPHKAVSLSTHFLSKYRWAHDSYMVLWGLVSLMFLIKLTSLSTPYIQYTVQSTDRIEKLAALFIFSVLSTGNIVLVYLSLLAIKKRYAKGLKEAFLGLWARLKRDEIPPLDHRHLHEELLRLPVLNWFDENELHFLLKKSRFLSLRKGQVVFEPGFPADTVLVLLTGRLMMQSVIDETSQKMKKWSLLPVSIFGEEAFLEGAERGNQAVASETCTVVEIPAKEILSLIDKAHYEIQMSSFRTAIMLNQYFHSAPIFSELSEDSIHFMMAKGILEEVRAGETIFTQGAVSTNFYLLIKGSVKVIINGEWINTIPQGGFFGEIGVIADIPRTATIEAETDSVLFKISADDFWEVLTQRLEMAIFLEAVGEIRLKSDYELLKQVSPAKIAS